MLLVHLKSHSSSIKTPSCGNGAHIGYNCPPKAPIISNPEQCNQTIAEPPQTLPSVHSTCNYEDENSFTYDSKLNSFNDSPSVLTHPPQLQFETYLCELCGNNAHYGYDCPPQFPLFPVNYPPQEASREILQAQEDLMEAIQAFLKEYDHIPPNEKCMALLLAEERFLKIKQTMKEEQNQPEVMQELLLKLMDDLQSLKGSQQEKKETAAQSFIPYWNSSMIDDEKARDNFLKDVCTFLRNDDESLSDEDVSMENYKIYSNPLFVDEEIISPKIDQHYFNVESNLIESLLNRDILFDSSPKFDYLLEEFSGELAHINPILPGIEKADFDYDPNREEINIFSGPDDSIPPGIESDFDSEEDIIDNLLNENPTRERLTFNIEPDAPVINNVDELNEDECFDPGGGEINVEVDNSFTNVTWIFLPYLTYPEVSPLLSSTKNEDTIFDPGIST
ncbi:hypothetical protein Tco_0667508 [Tanacetum coccineum]